LTVKKYFMKKILTILGARPQFIKAAPVSQALKRRRGLKEILVHTGQHYDHGMSAVFFDELGIPAPAYNLGVGRGGHGAQTGAMLKRLEGVFLKEQPDLALVYGDTNSTLAGALAAAKLRVPIAHVEAGLRSFNRDMPEEINRVIADSLSTLLFCPTKAAVANLKKEGIATNVFRTGDVMYDAARRFGKKAERKSAVLARLGLSPGGFALATVHRAENTDQRSRLAAVLAGLAEIAKALPVVFPMHPRTKKMIGRFGLRRKCAKLGVIGPTGFLDMIRLEQSARLILTDSGGVQKEAYFHRVPCVTLRNETEWVETVAKGWNVLAKDVDPAGLARLARRMTKKNAARGRIGEYGDGHAADEIALRLDEFLSGRVACVCR
jgi:UDP-GlcNAc3NAcA epimerase